MEACAAKQFPITFFLINPFLQQVETGSSSENTVHLILFLKIDKSFVDGMQDNKDSQALVKAIIAMASALDMKVVAEGVETLKQHKMLVDLGCKLSQGYLYSPLPASRFAEILTQKNPLVQLNKF